MEEGKGWRQQDWCGMEQWRAGQLKLSHTTLRLFSFRHPYRRTCAHAYTCTYTQACAHTHIHGHAHIHTTRTHAHGHAHTGIHRACVLWKTCDFSLIAAPLCPTQRAVVMMVTVREQRWPRCGFRNPPTSPCCCRGERGSGRQLVFLPFFFFF